MATAADETQSRVVGDLLEKPVLIVRAGGHNCALDLGFIVETLRPRPLEQIAGAPDIVRGCSIVRGTPIPVIDLSGVLGEGCSSSRRLVVVRTGSRRVGLLVDEVVGIRTLPVSSVSAVPPLLERAAAGAMESIATLDSELLLVLKSGRIVPDGLLDHLASVEH